MHWTTRARRVWLMVVVVLLGPVLLVPAPVANAAGTLTANPTVVKVATTSTKGKTTLTWTSGSAESVQVWVRKGNDPFVPTGLAGPSGSGDYANLDYGQPYIFRLYSARGQPLQDGATVIVTVELAQIKFDLGCAVKCITDVDLDVHGTYVDVEVKTNEPAGYLAQVTDDPPNADGSCKSAAWVDSAWKPTPKATTFAVRLKNLEPARKYCLKVIAQDANGKEETTYRTFTTRKRLVTVHFQELKVLADGDDGRDSGEMWIKVWVPEGNDFHLVFDTGTKTFTQDVTYQMPGAIKTVQHNATVLTLLASAHEDDGLSGGNTAMGNKDLNVADPSNAPTQYADDEGFGRPFTFKLGSGAIKIDFKGTYTVVYMP